MGETRQAITGKLADKYIIRAETEDDMKILLAVRDSPATVQDDAKALVKTPGELALIRDCAAALNATLADLGLPEVEVDPDFIHLYEPSDFESDYGEGSNGRTHYGNIFLKRMSSPAEFCHLLTHELAHLCSYRVVAVSLGTAPDGGRRIVLKYKRFGLSSLGRDRDTPSFLGLDEAATEAMAINVRLMLVNRPGSLSDDDRVLIGRIVGYPAVTELTRGLVRLVGEENGPVWAAKLLIRDYLGGTHRFLQELERRRKGAVRIIQALSPSRSDSIAGAKALGLEETAKTIIAQYDEWNDT